jgi:hypothetical protein
MKKLFSFFMLFLCLGIAQADNKSTIPETRNERRTALRKPKQIKTSTIKDAPIFCCVKIIYSALVSAVEGKMNGSKFYYSKGNNIISNKVRPKNKNSATQLGVRAAVKMYSGLWKTGNTTFMPAFQAYGSTLTKKNKIGTSKSLAGFNAYLMENLKNNFYYNLPYDVGPAPASLALPLTEPPAQIMPTTNGNIKNAVIVLGVTPSFKVDIPLVSNGDMLVLYATPPLSTGLTFIKGKFRPIDVYLAGPAQTAVDFLGNYQTAFGTPISGKQVFLQAEYVSILGSKAQKFYAGKDISAVAP